MFLSCNLQYCHHGNMVLVHGKWCMVLVHGTWYMVHSTMVVAHNCYMYTQSNNKVKCKIIETLLATDLFSTCPFSWPGEQETPDSHYSLVCSSD